MHFRSTNQSYVHYQGDIISNVSSRTGFGQIVSSHGVHLTGGSTGGIVTAAGDEANIALRISPKGTGPLVLGVSGASTVVWSTLNSLTVSSGGNFQLGSTAPLAGIVRQSDTAVATPDFNTTNMMVMETTHTIAGANSSCFLVANSPNLSTDCAIVGVFAASTAGQVHCRLMKTSTLAVAVTTATINFLMYRF